MSEDEHLPGPLPEVLRARVVALADETLGALAAEEVPAALRPFARFAPARRARLAATPLAAALDNDLGFRERVADRVRRALPDLVAMLERGEVPGAADPLDVAAAAYVLRPAGWPEVVAGALAGLERTAQVAAPNAGGETVTRLQEQLSAVRLSARADLERLRGERDVARAEARDLRRRLHEARQRARQAEEALAAAQQAAEADRGREAASAAAVELELRRLRVRLAEAEAARDASRRAVREGRSSAELRLRLLLDTVLEATAGLRRELALPPVTERPADAVAAEVVGAGSAGEPVSPPGTAAPPDDPLLLDALLRLPLAHLVVDGYNVTKTGYGSLPLEAQRERLLAGLGALAAQTGAEMTVVFDGADLDVPVRANPPRGVRVLFSPAGETADELIRRLVRAEPAGRPVVVVSSDREVADGVRLAGARALPAALLLRRLERG